MKSYKYRLLHLSSLAIDKALDEVNKLFQLKFYKNKLINYFDNSDRSPYQILFCLRNILEYSHTRTRTLFYFYINNIKFIFLYNKKLNCSGQCLPGESITINFAYIGYSVFDIRSAIIHELVHYFDQELIYHYKESNRDCDYECEYEYDYDYIVNRFEIPAFLMEAWFRYKFFKEKTFIECLHKILYDYFKDEDADKAYEIYIFKIKTDNELNLRFGHLLNNQN